MLAVSAISLSVTTAPAVALVRSKPQQLPLVLSGGLALALALVIGLVLHNFRKGAVIATATMFLFLSYGQFVRAIPGFKFEMAESVLGPNLLVVVDSVVFDKALMTQSLPLDTPALKY